MARQLIVFSISSCQSNTWVKFRTSEFQSCKKALVIILVELDYADEPVRIVESIRIIKTVLIILLEDSLH